MENKQLNNGYNAEIMIIDDTVENLTLLNEIFKSEGYLVRSSNSGELALLSIEKKQPDIILLDIKMPNLDGFEICKRLKEDDKTKNIPIIFISALNETVDKIKAFSLGATDFITKPFDRQEVIVRVKAHVKFRIQQLKLEESEEKFKYIFDNSPVGKSITLISGEINVNNKMCEMLGYTANELKGKMWQEITYPDDIENTQLEVNKLLFEEEKSIRFTKRYIKKDGTIFWADVVSSMRRDENNNPLYFMTSIIDITDRINSQLELKQSEERFRIAQEMSPDGFTILHPVRNEASETIDFTWVYENQAIARINQTDSQKIIGKRLLELFPEHKGTPIFEAYKSVSNTGKSQIIEEVYVGEVISKPTWLRLVIVPMSKDIAILAQDITERKENEMNIIKQNDLFVTLLKLLPVGVFMVDAVEGKPIIVNEMGKTLLGSGVIQDANEHNLSEVYKAYKGDTQNRYPTSEMPVTLGMKGISAHIEDMVIERPDGTRRLIEVFGTPVFGNQGEPWASLVTFMDITERKKVEDHLIYLNNHDHLTQLYNRRFFEQELKRLDIKENLPISIVMCDLNGLKLINDSFGHDFGDKLLIKAAETIKIACREDNIISRIGGDEFAVLLINTDSEETAYISNRIKELAADQKVANIEVSISYGYDTKNTDDQSIIEVLANAENHMYRHKLYERSSMRSKTIDFIMNTLFEKSHRESLHSIRVSNICQAIATKMNFSKENIDKMRIAGLVHDIGKIGIDEKILNKSGRLSDDEKIEVKRHPEVGWRILSAANEFSELALSILNHHEKWDGSGYPNGIKGEAIPLDARIITVADSYDAMISERPYKRPLSKEEAINELKRCSGTQFDPYIVDIFVNQVSDIV